MQGFKSFADTIELTFSNGITAIVGPNGSGKSNISDAVRWVLGEQSAKTLRGSKMEDVIFSGTQTRKRLGFAEVTLRLDNRDRHFSLDFDEISITRKVYASGESQYLINDTPCRLKDIHEVFMDTGLGRDGYSMIGQGKIDEILSTKSEDRRQIFEEAAGISKYRYRKEEAERRLRHTDENLDRVADIIGELESQIGPLEQQAEKAKKYLNLRDQLKTYDVNLALRIVERSRTQGAALTEKLLAVKEQLERAEKELSQADSEQEQCYSLFEELDEKTKDQDAALRTAEENIVIGQREIEVLKNTIEGNLRLLERVEQETADLIDGKISIQKNIADEQENINGLLLKWEQLKSEKAELAESLDNMDENAGGQSDNIKALKQEIAAAFDLVSESKIKMSNVDLLEQNLQARRRNLQAELSEREKELAEKQDKSGSLDAEFARKTEFIETLEKQLAQQKSEEQALENNLQEKEKEIAALELLTSQKKTRLHLLLEMEQNFEGYYKSVKEIMKQHENGMLKKAKIHGPVSKLLQVDKTYATAIGAAIGGALQNIVVETEEDAKAAINCLKQTGAGRATFMPISAVAGTCLDDSRLQHEPGFVGVASEMIAYEKAYEGIVRNLLGKTVVFQNVDQAILVSKKYKQSLRIVTLEGELFSPGGSIAGGSQQKGSQLLGREQEIAELKKDLSRAERQREDLAKQQKDLEKRVLDAAEEREKTELVYRENKEVLLLLERDKEHQDLLMSALEDSMRALKEDIQNAEQETEGLSSLRTEAAQRLSDAEKAIQEKRAALNELEQTVEAFANEKQKVSDKILEKGFEEAACQKEIENCREKITALEEELHQKEAHITLRGSEADEINKANETHKQEIAEKTGRNEAYTKEAEEKRRTIGDLANQRQAAEQKLRSLQGDAKDSRETVYNLKTEHERLCSQQEKLESESENAITRLWDEYEITYSEAEKLQQDLGADSVLTRQIAKLKGKIRELGNVNVDAIEELSTVSERYQFLTAQRDDLHKAKRDLLQIIDEMQTIMKKQFKEQFEKINHHFKSTFSELFGGGHADLSLSDDENVLECGIDIHVQPPGKKLQSLSLLSGGERALSAIALLFAILRIKPTPFCFLDEIEAALDENNVYRYADFIKRFSRHTQFILVTHRRGTMESADVIYGVTMQEKGVSKLLELNLEEIEA
ncbi:MAG: chromosome segregation protein SMC [Clostridia bacterium]|nr:chromosome segregation protein SMC [Clostridia bacterium]